MIKFENNTYDFIEKLDLENGIISLGNNPDKEGNYRGGYFTKLAISPPNYRKHHPTKYQLNYIGKDGISIFEIFDDWGSQHIIEIEENELNMSFINKNKLLII